MEKKIPLNIGLEILENPDIVRFNEIRFISPHFGFVNSFAKIESNLITIDQPYRIKEGRIAVNQPDRRNFSAGQATINCSEFHSSDYRSLSGF